MWTHFIGANTLTSEQYDGDKTSAVTASSGDDAPSPPLWWTAGTDDIKWAEVLYMNGVHVWSECQDLLFQTQPFDLAFNAQLPRPEDRFHVAPFLYSLIERQAKGPVMTHVKRLHQGKVSLQHLALPAARPKRVREGSSIRSANKVNKVWVSADTGNPFYTDELGNVLES